MAQSKGRNAAQFTYDFGISIAQSTVSKITRLTGASLTLASAFYALKSTATAYVTTLKENTLRFGGMVATIKAMEQAQNRLIKGQSYFSVDDQLEGMERLRQVGVDVGENFEWINKAAHATGQNYAEFSGMIASAIQGNSNALVNAGLMTQRAARMFDKYQANTVMRQQAILNFVKQHKGLQAAIMSDFETIQDHITRIRATWKLFVKAIVGRPNDPDSLYGQVASSMRMVSDAFSRNADLLKGYGYIIGRTLGWIVKQVGSVTLWLGRQLKKALNSIWKVTDNFQDQTRSFIVWLEFWKVKIIDFFKTYEKEIKNVLKLLILFKLLKGVFVIGKGAIASVMTYRRAILGTVALQKRYMQAMGPYMSKTAKFFQSLAVWLPAPFRKAWVWLGKFFASIPYNMAMLKRSVSKFFGWAFPAIGKVFKFSVRFVKNIPALLAAAGNSLKAIWTALNATNPVGWILLAITLLVTLYAKSKGFRKFINSTFKIIFESIKLIWNSLMYVVTWIMVGFKKIGLGFKQVWEWFKTYVWTPVANFFSAVWDYISEIWSRFVQIFPTIGQWIDKWIIKPITTAFQWIVDAWNWVVKGLGKALSWLSGANDTVSNATKEVAEEYGVPKMPTFSGGNYETEDGTNYLNPFRSRGNSGIPEPASTENPMLAMAGNASVPMGGTGSGNSTTMNFGNGAIQIVVQKGDNIDERVLAQKIKEVINDIQRNNNVRGGTL